MALVDRAHSSYSANSNGALAGSKGLTGEQPELAGFAEQVLILCGLGPVLDVGSGDGSLVRYLLREGCNAHGVDISAEAVEFAESCTPGRFVQGSILTLPHANQSFESVTVSQTFEYLAEADVPAAFAELHRVSRKFLVLRVRIRQSTNQDCSATTIRERSWWELHALRAGFRKHPLYYVVNPYESLDADPEVILIPLEKVPAEALADYPLTSLAEERNLHMDMTREVGERSDAHIIRYDWASDYVRSGDSVLDAASGLGYGSYVIRAKGRAARVVGIDSSEYSIDYAKKNFGSVDKKLSFEKGLLPECLSRFSEGSFDTIVSFETLEHVEDPERLIKEFYRILTPGGRLIVSVPNDWTDDSGKDPNPYHLHVYSFKKLREQIERHFLIEDTYQQIASGCKISSLQNRWHRQPRTLRRVQDGVSTYPDSEWCLMVGMKDPIGATLPYRESFYPYSAPPDHLLEFARDYANPWLVRSMVEFPTRVRNSRLLKEMATKISSQAHLKNTPDKAAALCVLGYQMLNHPCVPSQDIEDLIGKMHPFTNQANLIGHQLRWKISLGYLVAKLTQKLGRLTEAASRLEQLAHDSIDSFHPSLGTKIVDAAHEAGVLFYGLGDAARARGCWLKAIERAWEFLGNPADKFVGNADNPLIFPTVVAVEFVDSAVRSLKALRCSYPQDLRPPERLFDESRQNWKWMLDERTKALRASESLIEKKDVLICELETRLNSTRLALRDTEALVDAKDALIRSIEGRLREVHEALRDTEALVDAKDVLIRKTEALVDARDILVRDLQQKLDSAEKELLLAKTLLPEKKK